MNLHNTHSLRKEKYTYSYKKRAICSVPNRKVVRYKSANNDNNLDITDFSFFKDKTIEIINTSYVGFKREFAKDITNIQDRQHQAIPSLAYLPLPKKNHLSIFNKNISAIIFN